MKTSWSTLREEWSTFEAAVESYREKLRCSYRGAWFRGQESFDWPLSPGAFRSSPPPGLTDALVDFGGYPPEASDLRRVKHLRIDEPLTAALGFVEADIAVQIRRLVGEIGKLLTQLASIDDEIGEATVSARKKFLAKKLHDAARVEKRERIDLQRRRSNLAEQLAVKRQQIVSLRCLRYGEKDAYILFRARTNLAVGNSSWETLAAMQHYGVPTRLLDWTDALAVAVYFATKAFRLVMVERNGSIANWLETHAAGPNLEDFKELDEPVVWILNPFHLARLVIGQNTIEDLSLRPDLDYFECFHIRHCWPIPYAVPVTLPWRTPRMAAQRGYFTVHGTDVRGLEQQVQRYMLDSMTSCKEPILARVTLPRPAAVFAVRYVVQFVGLDSFTLFRDEDNLGVTLREFMRRS